MYSKCKAAELGPQIKTPWRKGGHLKPRHRKQFRPFPSAVATNFHFKETKQHCWGGDFPKCRLFELDSRVGLIFSNLFNWNKWRVTEKALRANGENHSKWISNRSFDFQYQERFLRSFEVINFQLPIVGKKNVHKCKNPIVTKFAVKET